MTIQPQVLEARETTFQSLQNLHGPFVGSKLWLVDNDYEIKTHRKVTTYKGGKVIKTNYIHIRYFNTRTKVSTHYREQRDGSFKQV